MLCINHRKFPPPSNFWLTAYTLVKNRTISERNEFSINIYRSFVSCKFSSQIPVEKLAISACLTTCAEGELRGIGEVVQYSGLPAASSTGNREVFRDLFQLNSVPEDKWETAETEETAAMSAA